MTDSTDSSDFEALDSMSLEEVVQIFIGDVRSPMSRILAAAHLILYCQRNGMEIKSTQVDNLQVNAQKIMSGLENLEKYMKHRQAAGK